MSYNVLLPTPAYIPNHHLVPTSPPVFIPPGVGINPSGQGGNAQETLPNWKVTSLFPNLDRLLAAHPGYQTLSTMLLEKILVQGDGPLVSAYTPFGYIYLGCGLISNIVY